MIVESGIDGTDRLRTILSDIRRDDIRASEVIGRLRTLLQKNEVEQAPFALDEAVFEGEGAVTRSEAPTCHPVGHRTAVTRVLEAVGFEVHGYASTGEFLIESPGDPPWLRAARAQLPGPSGSTCRRRCSGRASICRWS